MRMELFIIVWLILSVLVLYKRRQLKKGLAKYTIVAIISSCIFVNAKTLTYNTATNPYFSFPVPQANAGLFPHPARLN